MKKQNKSKKYILDKFSKNKENYTKNETGTGVQDLVKDVFEYLGFTPNSEFKLSNNKTYVWENKKGTNTTTRSDFILNFNGAKIVVEVEKLGTIEQNKKGEGFEQIKRYLEEENTPFGILTDGEKWYFYTEGYKDNINPIFINEILNLGINLFESKFVTNEYYINKLKKNKVIEFNTENQEIIKIFHNKLIQLAEKLKIDFSNIKIFKNKSEKEIIQTAYALIIQFILIKIIQDTKDLKLINKDVICNLLQNKNYNKIINEVFSKIKWLGDFYVSYKNEQDYLLNELFKYYNFDIDFKGSQIFLDLYDFIFSFKFEKIKQDIFGTIYENYLKELYKDDNNKKGQVFTPPEIVDFMLDNIGYTTENIEQIILNYINENGIDKLKKELINNETKVEFNIPGLSIIDPACGSGTFLYKVSMRIVVAIFNLKKNNKLNLGDEKYYGILSENLVINNIVGFDIEAFPLYLAEMNILITLLVFNISNDGKILNKIDKPINIFSTKDTIAEFANMENNIGDIILNLEKSGLFNINEKRNPKEISQIKLNIINGKLEEIVNKYLVNKIIEQIGDKKLIKKKTEFSKLKDLEEYIKNQDDKFLEEKFNAVKKTYNEENKKILELMRKYKTKRTKFDYVIGNPPYIAYNSISKEIRNNWKKIGLNMSNVFGINLHSIPGHQKKSPPKPNLYYYFGALAYFLAKDNGKVSYIVPEGMVAYDCNTYYLTNKVNLKKLYFFNTKVFVDRGLNGKIDIATSAIIFEYEKNLEQDPLKLWSYKSGKNEELSTILNYMKDEKNAKIINKDLLKEYISTGFSILKQDNNILNLLKFYKQNNKDIEIYYNHKLAEKAFGTNFYFDIGYNIDESNLYDIPKGEENNYYKYFLGKGKYVSELSDKGWIKDKTKIGLLKANQGYNLLDSKYKIVWNYNSNQGHIFYYEDRDVIWARNQKNGIGSNNRIEILYLFNILNSKLSFFVLNNTRMEGEKDYLISLDKIKTWIRVPNIKGDIKKQLKQKLIENAENIVKSINTKIIKYKDILEVELEDVLVGETVKGLKKEYKFLEDKINFTNLNTNILENNLPDNIISEIKKHSNIENLELERDIITYCLYFGQENPENNDFINLNKINIDNILESKYIVYQNKYVKIIEGINNEVEIKRNNNITNDLFA